jgi:hypothetical protein
MSNLTIIIEQVKDEIEVDALGKGKATVRAVARLVDVQHSSILKALSPGVLKPSKIAEILIEQGFDGGALASWKAEGIPDIAIASIAHYYAYEAGRYCTSQAKLVCKAFAAIGIRVWMQGIKGWGKDNASNPVPNLLPTPTLEEISNLLDLTLGKAGLDSRLVAGAKLNAIAKRFPYLLQETEEAKTLLVIPMEDRLLSPTQVGKMLQECTGEKWSAQRVNKSLIEKGLQEQNEEGDPDYLPTEEGKRYGSVTSGTAKGRDRTVQHLRWFPSVLEALEMNDH